MLIYFDRQGAIREIVSSYTLSDGTVSFKKAKGNSSVNRIYCYFEGLATALPSAAAGAMSYKLPDGSIIGPRVSDALETLSIDFDASRDLRYFAYDKDYAFLRFDVPDEVFSLSGLISATASATIGEATYQFGPITFMVDGEVLAQADIDYSQWRYLISQFARYLPLSGGTMAGAIISEGTGRKATFGDGILKLEDTVYGRETEIGKYAITADGGSFYYPSSAEAGGTLITDKWSGFSGYLPISGGEITGEITTNNDEIYQKVIIGNGRIGVQDTDDGAITYFDANYIERVGDKFYYPEWIENGGNLITNRWSGFNDYAKKTDLGNYATKKDFDDLKSVVYGIHSLTYNSYEFSYLASSIIPDEVDGRKVVGGSYAIMDWVGGNSFVYNQLIPSLTTSTISGGVTFTASTDGRKLTLSGTSSGYWTYVKKFNVDVPVGHKVLVSIKVKNPNNVFMGYILRNDSTETDYYGNDYQQVRTTTKMVNQIQFYGNPNIDYGGVEIEDVQLFDLTRMSLDNATTVEEAKAELLKRGVDVDEYNEFNDGEIKSTVVTKIESWGYNLFDGEWTGTSSKTSANFIKVVPGQTYTLEVLNLTTQFKILQQYNANKERIIASYLINRNEVNSIALENETNYVKLELRFASATDIPLDAVCFHLTGSRTGYAPYVGKLGQINIPNAPLRLDGFNDIHNTLTFEEQADGSYNAILKGKIESYTFTGNETIQNLPQYGENFMGCEVGNLGFKNETAPLFNKGVFKRGTISDLPVGSCYLYGKTLYYNIGTNDEQANRDFINGLTMYFQLATPTSEVIATGLSFDQVSFPIERGGAIVAVYEEVPPTASIDFMTKGE